METKFTPASPTLSLSVNRQGKKGDMMVLQHRRRQNRNLMHSAEQPLRGVEEPLFVQVKGKARDVAGTGTVVFCRDHDEGKREHISTFTFSPLPITTSSERLMQSGSATLTHQNSRKWDASSLALLVRAQSIVRRFLARKLCKRLKVLREMVQTESHYITCLRLLIKLFVEPLEAKVTEGKPIIEPQIILDIFSCIRELLKFHKDFFQRLQDRMRNIPAFRTSSISDIFLFHTKFLLLYPLYVNNFDIAAATLKKMKANKPEFAEFVRQREQRPEMKLQDVESFLLTPVQRVPQYTLLLQDLTKQYNPKTTQYQDLMLALQHLRDCLSHINEQKRDADNEAQAQALLQRFVYRSKKDQLLPNRRRRLLSQGPVTLFQKNKGKSMQLFVLSDALVLAKTQEKKPEKDSKSNSLRASRPVAQCSNYKVEQVVYLRDLNMLSVPSTAAAREEGRFSVHGGRGLKIDFGAEGGGRGAETWVRSIQLSLLAYQHHTKRKFLKTTLRRRAYEGLQAPDSLSISTHTPITDLFTN